MLLIVASASGGQIINSPVGLADPAITITFDEIVLSDGVPLTNEYAGLGVTFAGAFYNPQSGFFTTNSVGNFCCGDQYNNPSMTFGTIYTAVAFQFISNLPPPDSVFSAYLHGGLVDSFSAPTSLVQNWFGFTDIQFDEIRLSGGGSNGAFLMDNLQVGVPEPATFGLLSTALVGLVALARRRK